MTKAYLQHIAYYHPKTSLTNEDLSKEHPEWSADKISRKTGIERRYIAAKYETATDMAEKAADILFERFTDKRVQVDFLLLCTQSPDYFLPPSACILQERLGLSVDCGAFDFNLGCSGYVYGLGMAKGLIESGQASHVLLLTSETYSKYISPDDKSCKTIFGDGATASLITSSMEPDGLNAEILQTTYKTYGSGHQSLIVKKGAARYYADNRKPEDGYEGNEYSDYLFMDGKAIFEFSAMNVPQVLCENLSANNLKKEDICWYVLHQANQYMLNFIKVRCQIPDEKFVLDMQDGGNTVSSTIPIAISRMQKKGLLCEGQLMALCGFGVGLSIASTALRIYGKAD